MKQKDIYIAKLNPTVGSEQRGIRPVVIISGNTMNNNFNIVIVCPISSKIKNYASCVEIKQSRKNNLDSDGEVIPFQVRSISKDRLIKRIGKITDNELKLIIKKLNEVMYY